MTLLNGLLAFGAFAFTIPLAIHLLYRSRFRTVDWGAMHLLDSVVRINRRRMHLSNLLLLLLRCMIPVLLAFCLARPVLTGFQSLPGDAPESLILVIDDSRSMAAGTNGDLTRIEKAKQEIVGLLKRMSRRDEVILVRSSNIEAPPGSMGVSNALTKIRDIRAVGGPVDIGRLADAAIEAVTQASHQQRRVLIVSDFQSHMFGSGAFESLQRVSTALAEQQPKPIVGFWNFGMASEQLSNVSVDSIAVDSPAVVAGRSTQYSARIRNASDNPVNDLRVIWSINGQPLEPRIASIDPRASTTSRMNHQIDDPGIYEVSVSVEYGDALAADNRRSVATSVMREINVLLIDGQPGDQPLTGETDFLAIALSPFAFGGDDQPDAVRTTTMRISRVAMELSKSSPEVVVLANVRAPSDEAKQALADYVLRGGALVVFDGDQVKPDEYNSTWDCESGAVRMPALLGGVVGDPAATDAQIGRIGELNPQYRPWNLLARGDQRPLSEVGVRAYRALSVANEPVDANGKAVVDAATSIVLLRMVGGDPLVVAAKRGQGRMIQFGIPCDVGWSTLPLRLVYLPMMQQLILDLAGKGKAGRVDVGQPIAVPLREFDAIAFDAPLVSDDKARRERSYTVEVPSGDETVLQATQDGMPRLVWSDTGRAGTYRFRRISATKKTDSEPLIATTLRVVDVPEIESQLRDVQPDRLNAAADSLDAKVYTNVDGIRSDERVRRFGRETWRLVLVALLLFLVLELFVQQRLVRSTLPVETS